MSKLGNRIVRSMSDIDLETAKICLLESFEDYKKLTPEDRLETINPWFTLLDWISCRWGYHGELDSCIEAMGKKLKKTVKSFNSRKEFNNFLIDVGTYKEVLDKQTLELRRYLTALGYIVFSR